MVQLFSSPRSAAGLPEGLCQVCGRSAALGSFYLSLSWKPSKLQSPISPLCEHASNNDLSLQLLLGSNQGVALEHPVLSELYNCSKEALIWVPRIKDRESCCFRKVFVLNTTLSAVFSSRWFANCIQSRGRLLLPVGSWLESCWHLLGGLLHSYLMYIQCVTAQG